MLLMVALLPRNRNLTGKLRVEKDGQLLAEYPALGRGSRGGGDTTFLKNGNTPSGDYEGSWIETADRSQASYGPWGAVRLSPVSGNALLAQQVSGRNGILIHGGDPGSAGYWRGKGALRATMGCIRLANSDMQKLKELIEKERYDYVNNLCREAQINVAVFEL